MPRVLDDIKVGDWLKILVNGIATFEQVVRAEGFTVDTQNYRFTKYGQTWPKKRLSIVAAPASKDEVERWLEARS